MARLYAFLARLLLPAGFLDEYGAELTGAVADRLASAHGVRRASLIAREIADLLRTAAREWRMEFGESRDATVMKDVRADRRGGSVLDNCVADARFAVRRLRSRPGYVMTAVVTLALGVGGTAAVYGIARELLFEPLPYAHEREVGVFWKKTDWTEEEFLYLRGRATGFRALALYRFRDAIVTEDDTPARLVHGVSASADLFDVLGAHPLYGRGFLAGEDVEGAEPVAVLSYGLWQELGGDPAIVGETLTIDGRARTVVGVMPRSFWFPDPSVRIWTAEQLSPESRSWNSTLIGRVSAGRDVHALAGPVASIAAMLDERFDYPAQWDKTVGGRITPIRDDLVVGMRPALLATLGGMALLLLIACANVAALMLGQIDARSTELAVRMALGANRRRLTQQLVVETMLIATAAGLLGAAVATAGFRVLAGALPLGAWADAAAPDWTVFASAMAIATGGALLAALVPAIALGRGELHGVLGSTRTGGIQGRGGRLESGLVVAEVALAVLIAAGAALLVRSVGKLYALDDGVRTVDVAVVDVTLGPATSARLAQSIDELTAVLGALPGVRAAGAVQTLPLRGGGYNLPLELEGRSDVNGLTTEYRMVTPGYLEAMGIAVREGRTIGPSDRGDTEPVVVINEALAERYFPGENPVGRRIGDGIEGRFARVVGLVANAAERSLTDEPTPVRYVPLAQMPWVDLAHALVLRVATGADPAALLEAARRTVERVAPGVAVRQTTTMARVFDASVGPALQVMTLLSLLAGLALVLCAVGVYGVIAHFAGRRHRDWAIRLALGLPGSRIVTRVVRHGALLVAVGIAIGALAAAALARLLASLLYGVRIVDPLAFAAAGATLLVVGIVAALLPALRAARTDPAAALRAE